MALSRINANSITDDSITVDQIADTAVHGRRNRIINGDFQVWQRGTSSTTAGYSTADRFASASQNGAATFSQQSFTLGQTDVPGEPRFYYRHNQTTAATDYHPNIQQKIEGVRTLAGQTITLSLYAKASKSLTLKTNMAQNFGYGGSPSAGNTFVSAVTIGTLTTSWQRITYTVDVPSISGKTLGTNNDDRLEVYLQFPMSDTYTVDLALIQVEVGDKATPFEHRSYGEELSLCQRYFYSNVETFLGKPPASSTTQIATVIQYPVEMRANPSFSSSGTPKADPYIGPSITASSSSISFFNTSKLTAAIQISNFSGLTNSRIYNVQDVTVKLDAEL